MPLNPRQLEAFRMVMLRGSVTSAAKVMNVSQPAVSRLVRDLEVSTGLTLFERRGNHVLPTPEASLLLSEVERFAVGLQSLDQFARQLAGRKRGTLQVVALPAMAMGYMPRFVARFIEDRTLSRVYLHGMPSHLIVDAIAAGQYDIGVAAAPTERFGLEIEPLHARAVVVMPPGHRLATRRRIKIADLRGERFVALVEHNVFASPIPPELTEIMQQASVTTPLTGIACALVAAGAGIAVVDPFSAAGFADGAIVAVPLEPSVAIRVSIVTSASRTLSAISREFIAALRAEVDGLEKRRRR